MRAAKCIGPRPDPTPPPPASPEGLPRFAWEERKKPTLSFPPPSSYGGGKGKTYRAATKSPGDGALLTRYGAPRQSMKKRSISARVKGREPRRPNTAI